jgi:hypothetical protein
MEIRLEEAIFASDLVVARRKETCSDFVMYRVRPSAKRKERENKVSVGWSI